MTGLAGENGTKELRSSQGPNKESIVTWVRTFSGEKPVEM